MPGSGTTRDWVALVESGYRLERSEADWLQGIVDAVPFADEGPVVAYAYELLRKSVRLGERASKGADDIAWMLKRKNGFPTDRMVLDRLVRSGESFGSMSETVFTHLPLLAPAFRFRMRRKYLDVMGGIARDGRDSGIVVTNILTEPRSSTPALRARWERAAAHLGAGRRLRRRLASLSLDDENVEAILEPDGTVLDARAMATHETARDALRAAVKRMDDARSGARQSPDEALELWQALVEGRWSIVDRFDTDGRRFLVAHRNDVGMEDPRGLTPREQEVAELVGLGESNKAISYRLGVSQAAVSAAAQSAAVRLGLRGRVELATFFAPGGPRWCVRRVELAGESMLIARSAGINTRRLSRLTEAERSVALDLIAGHTNDAIARARGRAPSTVANQVSAIFDKLRVRSRGELAVALSS